MTTPRYGGPDKLGKTGVKQASAAVGDAADTIRRAGDTVPRVSEKLGQKAEESLDVAADQTERAFREVVQYIRDRPLTSLAIAFGVGYLLSRFRR